jgi:hypothetical protein
LILLINATTSTYQPETTSTEQLQTDLLNPAIGLDDGTLDGKMDIDSLMKFLGGEGVRALLSNTQLHEKIAEHINTYLPPGYVNEKRTKRTERTERTKRPKHTKHATSKHPSIPNKPSKPYKLIKPKNLIKPNTPNNK